MFQLVRNMSIYRRLFYSFALATIIPGIVIVLLGAFYLNSSQSRSDAVSKSFAAKDLAAQQQSILQRLNPLLGERFAQVIADPQNNHLLQSSPSTFVSSGALVENDIQGLLISFQENLLSYQQNYDVATSSNMADVHDILLQNNGPLGQNGIANQSTINNLHQALTEVVQDDWVDYRSDLNTVLNDLHPAQGPVSFVTAYNDLYQADADFFTLSQSWQVVFDASTAIGTAVTQVGWSLYFPLILATGSSLLFIILVVLGAGALVNITITRPLRQLVFLTQRVAAGDTNERAQVSGSDEIGKVAESMNGMLDNMVRLARNAQSRHAALENQIEKLVNEVSGIGEGDLRIQADVTTDELGVLADSFNFMAEELGTLVITVKTLARDVQNSTIQTFNHMVDLVANADTEIQQIAQAKDEISNFSVASRSVAERAHVLQSVALETRQNANAGRIALNQTFSGIERINKNVRATASKVQLLGDRSREINEIVKVISSIAHQTNRLALDAAIQAAMAGENGKGFRAVAVDIRRLAERAKEQTTIITQIVNSFFEDIGASTNAIKEAENETEIGSHLVQEAGTAFQNMFSVVEQQATEIESINHVAIQQLQSSDAVVLVMQNVSDMTQKASSITHNAAREMEHLAQLAAKLQTSVEVFKIRDDREQDQQVVVSEQQDSYRQALFDAPTPIPAISAPGRPYTRRDTPLPYPRYSSQQNSSNYGVAPSPSWQQVEPNSNGGKQKQSGQLDHKEQKDFPIPQVYPRNR
jgi:methyl-accepting chemotaxis protein